MREEVTLGTHLSAASIAGAAILLEIGEEYGVARVLRGGSEVELDDVVTTAALPEPAVARYLEALVSAGLLESLNGGKRYKATGKMSIAVHDVGYVSWALRACAPLIANARAFAAGEPQVQERHPRDGKLVARTSQWMGEKSFYPHAEDTILSLSPKHIVDLGCGVGALLIRLLGQLDGATGVGVDISEAACNEAKALAEKTGFADRITFIRAPIQMLADDPRPLVGADVIHAGFVFHDLMPDDEPALDKVLYACRKYATSGKLVIVDAVPYAADDWERMFSAAFSYLHHNYMGRRLLGGPAWCDKLCSAGFSKIEIKPLGLPGGRILVASGN